MELKWKSSGENDYYYYYSTHGTYSYKIVEYDFSSNKPYGEIWYKEDEWNVTNHFIKIPNGFDKLSFIESQFKRTPINVKVTRSILSKTPIKIKEPEIIYSFKGDLEHVKYFVNNFLDVSELCEIEITSDSTMKYSKPQYSHVISKMVIYGDYSFHINDTKHTTIGDLRLKWNSIESYVNDRIYDNQSDAETYIKQFSSQVKQINDERNVNLNWDLIRYKQRLIETGMEDNILTSHISLPKTKRNLEENDW